MIATYIALTSFLPPYQCLLQLLGLFKHISWAQQANTGRDKGRGIVMTVMS